MKCLLSLSLSILSPLSYLISLLVQMAVRVMLDGEGRTAAKVISRSLFLAWFVYTTSQ